MRFHQLLFLFASGSILLSASENVVPNPGFEKGMKDGWFGGPFGKGEGVAEVISEKPFEGKSCAHLFKKGGGGSQLFSPMIPVGKAKELDVSFRYRGSGNLLFSFWHREGGKYVETKSALGKGASKYFRLKKSDVWTEFKTVFSIPEAWRLEGAAVRFQFQVWGRNSSEELFLDNISVKADAARVEKETEIYPNAELIIRLPEPLSPKESADYGPVPGTLPRFELKDGLIYRNGRPYFWVGDGDGLGSSQSNVMSMWMAKVLMSRFSSLDGGAGKPFARKKTPEVLEIAFSNAGGASLYSFVRELLRYGIYSELPCSSGMYRFSALKGMEKKYPALAEIFFDGSHFYSADHNTSAGRMLNEGTRATIFRYIRNMPFFGLEAYRELGYTPSHERVRREFREYARQKYGSLNEANKVWRRAYPSWEKVQPPHLETDGILDDAMQLQLRAKVSRDFPEMYYDWLRFVQLDLVKGLKEEKKDFRKWSNAPFMLDLRAHSIYSDGYMASDPDLVDRVVDIFCMHRGFSPFEHNNTPTDFDTLNRETLDTLMAYNFFKTNSTHAIWNAECIVSKTGVPGTSRTAMERNDFGRLHGEWNFRQDEEKIGFSQNWWKSDLDDSAWSKMTVPGCWDDTKEFKGKSGWAWYRKTFVPEGAVRQDYLDGSRKFLIYGRGIAQKGVIWLNGYRLGEVKGWNTPYQFDVGKYLKFGEKNQITVFVDGSGFSNGLRHYIHLLAHDQINEEKAFGEKQYVSMLWSYMMQGSSAVSLWNWTTLFRPWMPGLIQEINSVSDIVLPDLRKNKSTIAFLYPYLYAKGLPFVPSKDYNDYMHYYNAFEFSQHHPDVFSETNFLSVDPERCKIAVFPYAKIVQKETWEHFKRYVKRGGTAIVTCHSLQKTFERYRNTEIEQMAGIRILGENRMDHLLIGGKRFRIVQGDANPDRGVRIAPDGAKVLYSYPDGSPAVTIHRTGKGKILYIAPRLEMDAIQEILKDRLPKPEIQIVSSNRQEKPYIEAKIAGNAERSVLYLHNWGGTDHELTVTIPQKFADYRIRPIRGEFTRIAPHVFQIKAEASAPSILLLESPGCEPKRFLTVSPEHKRILKRLTELDRDGNGKRPSVLFLAPIGRTRKTVGRPMFPMLTDALDQLGYETKALDYSQWTPQALARHKMLFLAEDHSICYNRVFAKGSPFRDNVLEYVKNGGSLFLVVYTGITTNAQARLIREFGTPLGASISWGSIAYDPKHCGFGDPLQIRSHTISSHEIGRGIRNVQLYVNRPMSLKKNSPLVPVVLTNPGDERQPGKAVIAAGTYGKGRIVLCSDLMWLQPFRIEKDDNARCLMNVLEWLLRKEISAKTKENFRKDLFITMEKLETENSVVQTF